MRLFKKMPSFNAVAAGQTAIANLPIGLSYHQLMIRYATTISAVVTDATEATLAADIDEIRLLVDGDAKITLSGAELIALQKFYGQTITAGVLPLHFSRPWKRTVAAEDETAYGTANVQTMTLEVDLASTLASSGTSPSLELYALQGPQTPLGRHVCIRRFAYNASATGVREIPDIPRGPYALLALHFGTADIADIEVEANQKLILDADKPLLEAYYEQTFRAWQTGYWHADFAATSRLSDALPLTLEDFRLRLNMIGTGSFNILAERLESRAA